MLNGTESIKPLRDRVLVKELPWRNQTATGLHLPDTAQKGDHVWRAVVVAVGPGKPALGVLKRALEVFDKPRPRVESLDDVEKLWPATSVRRDIEEGLDDGFGIDGVKPGDVVLVSKYVHSKIGYGTEQLCCIAATDILGVVEGDANDLRRALETALAKLDAAAFAADEAEVEPELVAS